MLRAETERARLDFIRTDLGVLPHVAETAISMGHGEHADRTIASAEKSYSDMLRFFSQATGMTALWSKFRQLRERLCSTASRREISQRSLPGLPIPGRGNPIPTFVPLLPRTGLTHALQN